MEVPNKVGGMSAFVGLGGETEACLVSATANVELAATAITVGAVPVNLIWERRFWEHGDSLVVDALLATSSWEYRLGVAKGYAGCSTAWAA